MKFLAAGLIVFALTPAWAGLKEDLPSISQFCRNLPKDQTKVEMRNGKLVLVGVYIDKLMRNPKELNSVFYCDLVRINYESFRMNHQSKFEVAEGKRYASTDRVRIVNQLLEMAYNDKDENKRAAFIGAEEGMRRYYLEKINVMLEKAKKIKKIKK